MTIRNSLGEKRQVGAGWDGGMDLHYKATCEGGHRIPSVRRIPQHSKRMCENTHRLETIN